MTGDVMRGILQALANQSPRFGSLQGGVVVRWLPGPRRNRAIFLAHAEFESEANKHQIWNELRSALQPLNRDAAQCVLPTPNGPVRLEMARPGRPTTGPLSRNGKGRGRGTGRGARGRNGRSSTAMGRPQGPRRNARPGAGRGGADHGDGTRVQEEAAAATAHLSAPPPVAVMEHREDVALEHQRRDGGGTGRGDTGPSSERPRREAPEHPADAVSELGPVEEPASATSDVVPRHTGPEAAMLEQIQRLCLPFAQTQEDGGQCVVCRQQMLQGDNLLRLPCLHVIHQECAVRWWHSEARNQVPSRARCPYCNVNILTLQGGEHRS